MTVLLFGICTLFVGGFLLVTMAEPKRNGKTALLIIIALMYRIQRINACQWKFMCQQNQIYSKMVRDHKNGLSCVNDDQQQLPPCTLIVCVALLPTC